MKLVDLFERSDDSRSTVEARSHNNGRPWFVKLHSVQCSLMKQHKGDLEVELWQKSTHVVYTDDAGNEDRNNPSEWRCDSCCACFVVGNEMDQPVSDIVSSGVVNCLRG